MIHAHGLTNTMVSSAGTHNYLNKEISGPNFELAPEISF